MGPILRVIPADLADLRQALAPVYTERAGSGHEGGPRANQAMETVDIAGATMAMPADCPARPGKPTRSNVGRLAVNGVYRKTITSHRRSRIRRRIPPTIPAL
jgi:hypothetical protein